MESVLVRRSELICPASSPKMMAKAAESDADQVIFDLEDGCAVSQKIAARQMVTEALRTLDFGGKLCAYRVNGLTTPYCYRDVIDVVETVGAFIDVIILPKIDDAADILFFDRLLTQIEVNAGLEIGRIRLEALIESAKGALHAEAIATSTPRLSGLIFGLVDFAGDIGAQEVGAEQFFYYNYAKAKVITAARAAGLTAVDGV
ncbi:MAG TPA: aldolase/citrate lyase family protein, partial [Ktedonobacterales bacterium]|nr:aldolase/citrate lyase family protein [Ktedonobacterales bacterium]